jgi:hypothetical protein
VPVLSRARLPEEELLARISILSCYVADLRDKDNRSPVWPALGDLLPLPGDRFGVVADAVLFLSRSGIDPKTLARWALEASSLPDDAFRRVFESAVRIGAMRLDPQQLLTPFLRPEQPLLPAPDLQALWETLEQIVETLPDRRGASVLSALGKAMSALPPDRSRLALDVTQRMLSTGMDPAPILGALPPLAALGAPRLAAALDLAARLAAAGIDPLQVLRNGILPAANASAWPEYLEVMDAALRLAEDKIDPLPLLQHGVSLASGTKDFSTALRVVNQYLVRTATWNPTWLSCRSQGLQSAHGSRTSIELEETLRVFEALVDRIQRSGGGPSTSPGLAELTRQALAATREYSDFTITLHPAVTHEEESYDSYYGSSSYTVEDEPARLELKPTGYRRVAVSLALRSSPEIEALLAERSWLWRSLAEPVERAQALERSAAVRGQLGTIVDRMMRSGLLKPHQSIAAIYLIGSYPWREHPGDIDLFILVKGHQEVARFTRASLEASGFEGLDTGAPLDLEVVGWETLLTAVRGGDVRHAEALARRSALLYGSVLLAGRDFHEGARISSTDLKMMHTEIIENSRHADWPELVGDPGQIETKRAWRLREAEALSRFLDERERADR